MCLYVRIYDRSAPVKSNKEKDVKTINSNSSFSDKFKVELQILKLSEESEQQLYDSLIHIYGNVNIYSYLLDKYYICVP